MISSKYLKLAKEADLNGDFELADFLDSQLVRTASVREAQWWKTLFGGGERAALEAGEKFGLQKEMLGQGKFPLTQLGKVNPEEAEALKLLTDIRPGLPQKTVAQIPFIRSEAELQQIANALKERIKFIKSTDEEINKGIQELARTGKIEDPATRRKVFDEAIKQGVVLRNSKGRPEDVIAILKGEPLKPEAVRQGLKPWINNTAKGAAGLAAGGTVLGLYNATNQQSSQQPGSVYEDPIGPGGGFERPEQEAAGYGGDYAGGGGYDGGSGGSGGGYQGPTYQMPSANQSFQPSEGYRPANQVEQLPRFNDQAEPLYPRITPQQAMQNAMIQDQARRYQELMAQGGSPAQAPTIGTGNQEIYGPTQDMVNSEAFVNPNDDFEGMQQRGELSTFEQAPQAATTEGTNDPNANIIYNPEAYPRTDNYQLT